MADNKIKECNFVKISTWKLKEMETDILTEKTYDSVRVFEDEAEGKGIEKNSWSVYEWKRMWNNYIIQCNDPCLKEEHYITFLFNSNSFIQSLLAALQSFLFEDGTYPFSSAWLSELPTDSSSINLWTSMPRNSTSWLASWKMKDAWLETRQRVSTIIVQSKRKQCVKSYFCTRYSKRIDVPLEVVGDPESWWIITLWKDLCISLRG